MPTRVRRLLEEQRHKARLWSFAGAFLMGVAYYLIPKTPVSIAVLLAITFAVTVPLAQHGYVYRPRRAALAGFLVLHALILVGFGYVLWPELSIAPRTVILRRAGQYREFLVDNNLTSERHNVDIIFHLNGDDPLKTLGLSIQGVPDKQLSNGDPLPGMLGMFAQSPSGEKVTIAMIDYLEPHEKRRLTVQYRGNKEVRLRADKPISWAEGPLDSVDRVDQHHWATSFAAHMPDGYRVYGPIIVYHMGEISQ